MLLTDKDIERFWSKIDVKGDNECWPWVAKSKLSYGYGAINVWVSPEKRQNVAASRLSCFLAYGPPPTNDHRALHSCDNPPCCNPGHLRWGTQKDNVADAIKRNRQVNPPDTHSHPEWNAKRLAAMPKGEALHNQSLTETLVREIWRLHFEGKSATEIADILGVKRDPVIDACRGRSWRHLHDAPSVESLKESGAPRGFNQFSRGGNTRDLHPRSKLTSGQAQEIKRLFDEGLGWKEISERYNVSKCTVYKARKEAS